ncbi:hypothetical protein PR202_ga16844 [Eleusine coracana subsp. coracana]|uniref:Retrotransposon gag domain-containing protein n=1 Tax=Eleusine coracana subsp. coracana TaxID=191504 RepID=A0AAV5CNM5_ELECO|nr:hypothetical protein PR202_ga16844 [Eleusine coracana subsp. coracana]
MRELIQQNTANRNARGNNDGAPQKSIYADFLATSPPTFSSTTEPMEAENFFRMLESKFGLLNCTSAQKTLMSTTGPSRTLRELSLPSPDVLVPQPSDEKATTSSYVLNPIIISMAEANKFFGAKEENRYTHLQDLEVLCQAFHHEGVPRDLYRWLLFPFSLGGKAKEWHKAASREAKGKWSELVGNFCLRYFPLPKVQKLRREVAKFLQEDEESLAEAWTRFQTLLKQGPDLGIDENMCAQTFYMAIDKESRMHLEGSAGGSFLRLTAKVEIELLSKIVENEALHKHWEEYLEPNRQCPEVMKKEESPAEQILMSERRSMITSGQFEEIEPVGLTSMGLTCAPIDAVSEPIGAAATTGEPITLTTPPSRKEYTKVEAVILDNQLKEFEGNFAKPKGDRTLANAKPLVKFESMDWIPIDFSQEFLNMRRSFSLQDAFEAGIEYNFPNEAPEVEQKELPMELRYEYLGKNRTYPVIMNNTLTKEETERLLVVLKRYKKAIGYTLDDIREISPAFCTHKINLEENTKPVVEGMRRLKESMKLVVKKEILKLLNVDMIYPVGDSEWKFMKKSEADAWNADKVKMDNELRQMMKRVLVRKGKSVASIESEVVSQRYTMENLLDLATPLSYEDFLSFERSLTEQEKEELDEQSTLTIHRCRLYGEHDIAAKYELKL